MGQPCTYGAEPCGVTDGTRLYQQGPRCTGHTPAALAGREDIRPDPDRTIDALREKANQVYAYRRTDTQLLRDRSVVKGQARSTPAELAAAKAAEAARKARETARRKG